MKVKTNTVTDLRKNTVKVLDSVRSSDDPVFILQNSKISCVMLDYDRYQEITQMIEDYQDIIDSEDEVAKGEFVDSEELKKYV